MGIIKYEDNHLFSEGHVYVFWDVGEEEYGYEIELSGEEGIGGVLVTINNWSFGYEDWSRDVWVGWGNYISEQVAKCNGVESELVKLISEITHISCDYTPDDKENHLRDLVIIKSLIAEMDVSLESTEAVEFV